MLGQPGAGGEAVVGGEVVGDDHEVPVRIRFLHGLQEALVVGAVAGSCGHDDLAAVGRPQGAVDPGLLRDAPVAGFAFDPVPVRRPARSGGEGARDHGAQFDVDTFGAGRVGEGIQGPLGRSGLPGRRLISAAASPATMAGEARRGLFDQCDNAGALSLGDPPHSPSGWRRETLQ